MSAVALRGSRPPQRGRALGPRGAGAALVVQGLWATSAGGPLTVQEAVTAQLDRSGTVVRPFKRLRRTRNDANGPLDTPELTGEDTTEDLPKARDIVIAMHQLIPHLQSW